MIKSRGHEVGPRPGIKGFKPTEEIYPRITDGVIFILGRY